MTYTAIKTIIQHFRDEESALSHLKQCGNMREVEYQDLATAISYPNVACLEELSRHIHWDTEGCYLQVIRLVRLRTDSFQTFYDFVHRQPWTTMWNKNQRVLLQTASVAILPATEG